MAFSELTSELLRPVKQYSSGHNSCHTGPFGEMDSLCGLAWPLECNDFANIPRILEAGEGPKLSRRIRF